MPGRSRTSTGRLAPLRSPTDAVRPGGVGGRGHRQGWRETFRAVQEDRLVTDVLCAVVRPPRYKGIFLAIVGQLVHRPTVPAVVLAPLILWAYWAAARCEERKMIEELGDEYRSYRDETPMFLPGRRGWRRLLEAVGWEGDRTRFSDRTEGGDA